MPVSKPGWVGQRKPLHHEIGSLIAQLALRSCFSNGVPEGLQATHLEETELSRLSAL